MSLLIGQSGSKQRGDYIPSTGPSFAAKGNFMDPERPSSLGIEDRSRFRPQSFVAPRNIGLMQGAFNIPGASDIPSPSPQKPIKSAHGWYMSE